MAKKIIGIGGNQFIHYAEAFHGNQISYTPQGFVTGVEKAGGLPLIIPIQAPEMAKNYVDMIDKLLLTGGQDVSPWFYGEEPTLKISEVNPKRDAFELALVSSALETGKPILAVCRGLQILNVALGGTLYQDLADYPNLKVKHVQSPTDPQFSTHYITIKQYSYLENILKKEKTQVNSYHHQAIANLSPALKAVAWSSDGLVEAVEGNQTKSAILGVQWHPELNFETNQESFALFEYFVNQL